MRSPLAVRDRPRRCRGVPPGSSRMALARIGCGYPQKRFSHDGGGRSAGHIPSARCASPGGGVARRSTSPDDCRSRPRGSMEVQMRIERELADQRPTLDLDAPTTTYRISVDVDMARAEMSPEQACGLFVVVLEGAY